MSSNVDYQYRQITCQRAVNGSSFPLGVQDYNFSVGRPYGWIPARSYFRIAMTLSGPLGGAPVSRDGIAFADSVCGNLFNNVYVRAGGQDVSSIVNYVPQAQQIKNRLDKSGAWLNSVGRDSFGCDADFASRQKQTSSGFPLGPVGATVEIVAATGRVTGANGALLFTGDSKLDVNDQIVVNGITYTVTTAATADDGTACIVAGDFPGGNDVAATTVCYKVDPTKNADGDGRNIVYLMWQPPVGIWDETKPLGSGDYRIQLNPNSYYKTACVESLLAGLASPAAFNFAVNDIQLFIATVKVDIPVTGVDTLHLMEMQIQSKALSAGTQDSLLDFTVPPSTKAISIFVQSNKAGNDTKVPPSTFKALDRSDENLSSIQITYANSSKPATRWTSELTPTTNYMKQRYNDTQLYSGKFWSEGGTETFAEWLKRGPLYHYSFIRDESDRSTHVQLNSQFGNLAADCNIMICAHFSRAVEITSSNGFVTSVVSLST
jgi:hypothetical protein